MSRTRPYLMLAVIILLWGTNFIVSQLLSGIHPIRVSGVLFALFRYTLAGLTMATFMAYQRKGIREIVAEIYSYRKMLMLSALFAALFVIGIHTSTEFLPSGTTSIIMNLSPILVLVFGVLFLSERARPVKIIGFILALVGGLLFLWTGMPFLPGDTVHC